MNVVEFIAGKEGYRLRPYYCSEKYPTIGYGKKLGPKNSSLSNYDFELPEPVAFAWLGYDVSVIKQRIKEVLTGHEVRDAALISMAYQLGISGFSKFKLMLEAVKAEDWKEAEKQALDSRWAKQTPERAIETARMLRLNEWR